MIASNYKQVGKLKKGAAFIHGPKNEVFIITKSGFGTGKYVDVEFGIKGKLYQTTYSLPKKTDVLVCKN